MYIKNISVKKDGTLDNLTEDPLIISNEYESKRVRLSFSIDPEIDNTYHYIRFTHAKTSILFRVNGTTFDITRALTSYEGIWKFAFIITNEVVNNDGTFTCDYQYTSNPYTAVVTKGIESRDFYTGDQLLVKHLIEGTFTTLVLPEYVTEIGSYCLANYPYGFNLTVGENVRKICERAFSQALVNSITFSENSILNTIEDYAFSRVSGVKTICFPRTVTNYGKYILEHTTIEEIKFEDYSRLSSVGSYCFWDMPNLKRLYLPDHLTSFTGKTSFVRGCPELEYIFIPATITETISKVAFPTDDTQPSTIELGKNFNISANFSNCTNLSREAIVNMFYSLKKLEDGQASKSITIGSTNLAKLEESDILIATNKGWTVS